MAIVTLRHYVGNFSQVDELEQITDRILSTINDPLSKNIKLRLKLGTPDYNSIKKSVRGGILYLIDELRGKNISADIFHGYGIGHAFIKTAFDSFGDRAETKGEGDHNLFLVDGDQFDISDKRVLKSIKNLDSKLTEENFVLGLALRDFVQLSSDNYDDSLRRIEELSHLNAIPGIVQGINITNPQRIDTDDVHPAYLKYGDIVPGLIGFQSGEVLGDFFKTLNTDIKHANLTGYAGDPYCVMATAILGGGLQKVCSEIVPTTRQTRGSRFDRDVLTRKAQELKKTFVGHYYEKSIRDEDFSHELEKYFDSQIISDARARILKGFE